MNALHAARLNDYLRPTSATRTVEEEKARLRGVSEMFTGFFMGQMLKSMRGTIQQGEFGHGGSAENQFQTLMDEEFGYEAAAGHGYGLTEMIYQSLLNGSPLAKLESASETVEAMRDGAARLSAAQAYDAAVRTPVTEGR